MRATSFLAVSVAILSSLAIAAPVDAKREELHSENTQRSKNWDYGNGEKRQAGVYSNLVLKIKEDGGFDGEKRAELYSENTQRLEDDGGFDGEKRAEHFSENT